MSDPNLVWYAGYGSNLSEERFSSYLSGGLPKYGVKNQMGCRNKNLFVKKSTMTIPYELYFAQTSASWENKGVAFIRPETDPLIKTNCVCYLVQMDQLIDIFLQENDRNPFGDNVLIDLDKMISNVSSRFVPDADLKWYGKIINVGELEGLPVLTFTALWNDQTLSYSKPGNNYLKTIIEGLRENFDLNNREIFNYLSNLKGLADVEQVGTLNVLIAECQKQN